jgi:hypothetical protein
MNCIVKGLLVLAILYIVTQMLNKAVEDNTIVELRKLQKWKEDREQTAEIKTEVKEELKTIEAMANEAMANEAIEGFDNKKTVTLFYGTSCPASISFMPTWERIKNGLADDIDKVEVECYSNKDTCTAFDIKIIPTLLITNGVYEKKLSGNMPFDTINEEMRLAGITVDELREGFTSNNNDTTTDECDAILGKDCSSYWFEKRQGDKHCILGGNQLHGCADGSLGSGISPSTSAHSVFGSYVNLCGKTNGEYDDNKLACIIEKHGHSVANLGLQKLDILGHQSKVDAGTHKPSVRNHNYDDNIYLNQIIQSAR